MTNDNYIAEKDHEIFVANKDGIFQSSDKGKSWKQLDLEKHLRKRENIVVDKYILHQAILMDIIKE